MKMPSVEAVRKCLDSRYYSKRLIGEYWFVRDKYEKLHRMIVRREAGKLEFEPESPMELWKAQTTAMGNYLFQLEVRAQYEEVDLDDIFNEADESCDNSN
jgi:hypothetical protein